MFSEKEIKAYKNITAPDRLYDRIKSKSVKKSRLLSGFTVKAIGAVAAAFVLISVIVLLMGSPAPEVICNGQVLEDSVLFYDISPASDMRASPVFSVPFELELKEKTEITVSYGKVLASEGEVTSGTTLKGEVSLWWEIPRTEEIPPMEMELTDKNGVTLITLTYDNAEKTITATKTSK